MAADRTTRPVRLPEAELRQWKVLAGAVGVSCSKLARAAVQEIAIHRAEKPPMRRLREIRDALPEDSEHVTTAVGFPVREWKLVQLAADRIEATQPDVIRIALAYVAARVPVEELREKALALPGFPPSNAKGPGSRRTPKQNLHQDKEVAAR